MTTQNSRSIIIVGAGIAGLVASIFLSRKGWDVAIYEKVPKLSNVHGGLYLQSNGVKVMSLMGILSDLLQPDKSAIITHAEFTSWTASPRFLLNCPLLEDVANDAGGYPVVGIRRSLFQIYLYEKALQLGVQFHFGKMLQGIEQSPSSVTAEFSGGTSATASFLIGCDGIHSSVRKLLFGQDKVSYTGLSQVAAIVPTPAAFSKSMAHRDFYGPGSHIVFYNVSDTHCLLAATLPESDGARESWGNLSEEETAKWKEKTPFLMWGGPVVECIQSIERVIKYGLYDRPPLTTWHKGRVLLIGDAAHPTSPPLGQGANQAMEDVYHLIRLMSPPPKSPTSPPLSTSTLDTVWTEYETLRIARTASFVLAARKRGEERTLTDPAMIEERDARIRAMYEDKEATLESWRKISRQPFFPTSDIVF